MGQDEFFSFGDEEFDDPAGSAPPSGPDSSDSGDGTTGLHDAVAAPPPEKGARRSRGDSTTSSSEKRTPPSRGVRIGATVALAVAAVLLVRVLVAGHSAGGDPDRPVVASPSGAKSHPRVGRSRQALRPSEPADARTDARSAGRSPAGNRQHSADSRGLASRRRQVGNGSNRSHSDGQPTNEPDYEPAYEPPAPSPVVTPSATETAPAGDGLHSGTNSPEFGL
jgi:hypothetical protein